MDSIEALSKALVSFEGGLLIVSHDQEFLDAVCSEVWVCSSGGLDKFEGKAGAPGGVVWQYKQSLLAPPK
jgi:ATP-binding cassette subfamily F protein 3